jgi:hypothetical protein
MEVTRVQESEYAKPHSLTRARAAGLFLFTRSTQSLIGDWRNVHSNGRVGLKISAAGSIQRLWHQQHPHL